MAIWNKNNSFYREISQGFTERAACLSPWTSKIAPFLSFLACPLPLSKISDQLAKYTVSSLSNHCPSFVSRFYDTWCRKQAISSMQTLEPILMKNPYLAHTLLGIAAWKAKKLASKIELAWASVRHLAMNSLSLQSDYQKHTGEIIDYAILPVVKKGYLAIARRGAIQVCYFANFSLLSYAFATTVSALLSPAYLELREKSLSILSAASWGVTAYLYAPLVYHSIRGMRELVKTWQDARNYEKKLEKFQRQITASSEMKKMPKKSIQAVAILLATIS